MPKEQRLLARLWLLIASIFGIHASIFAIEIGNEQEFIRKHSMPDCPERAILDRTFSRSTDAGIALRFGGCDFLRREGKIVAIHPGMKNYIIKAINYHHETFGSVIIRTFHKNRNLQRIAVNEKIKECIKKNNLRHIVTPQKYLYHIPGRPHDLNDMNYIVISEKLELFCKNCNRHQFGHHATPVQRAEILTVIRYVGYGDSHLDNICFLKNGKIAIIDTEPHGSVDFLSVLPGFDRATHALSVKVGEDLFKEECKKVAQASVEQRRAKKREIVAINETDCEDCGSRCHYCALENELNMLDIYAMHSPTDLA